MKSKLMFALLFALLMAALMPSATLAEVPPYWMSHDENMVYVHMTPLCYRGAHVAVYNPEGYRIVDAVCDGTWKTVAGPHSGPGAYPYQYILPNNIGIEEGTYFLDVRPLQPTAFGKVGFSSNR